MENADYKTGSIPQAQLHKHIENTLEKNVPREEWGSFLGEFFYFLHVQFLTLV